MGASQSQTNTIVVNSLEDLQQYLPYIEEDLKKDAERLSEQDDDIYFFGDLTKCPDILLSHPQVRHLPFANKLLKINPNIRCCIVSKYIKRPHIIGPVFSRGYAIHWLRGSFPQHKS